MVAIPRPLVNVYHMPGGRPTKMTAERIAKLESAWLWGCSDSEACCYAEINPSSLYRHCEKDPEFRERKEILKQSVVMRAKRVVSEAIDNSDIAAAQKLLDRKEGSKVAVTGSDGGDLVMKTVVEFVNAPDTDS